MTQINFGLRGLCIVRIVCADLCIVGSIEMNCSTTEYIYCTAFDAL